MFRSTLYLLFDSSIVHVSRVHPKRLGEHPPVISRARADKHHRRSTKPLASLLMCVGADMISESVVPIAKPVQLIAWCRDKASHDLLCTLSITCVWDTINKSQLPGIGMRFGVFPIELWVVTAAESFVLQLKPYTTHARLLLWFKAALCKNTEPEPQEARGEEWLAGRD
jgi:hypothetical protein